MIQPMRVAILASGGGTNFQALIEAYQEGLMPHVELALLVASKPSIGAIDRADANGIPHLVLNRKQFEDEEAFDNALLKHLEAASIDALVLAGYLGILSWEVIAAFPKRILNIHPSLIPSFCGKGFYGMHVHEAVIASGVKITGATVHFVDGGIDTGAILLQDTVVVEEIDTPESIQKKVLAIEHKLLPEAVQALASNQIEWHGNRAFVRRLR